MVQIRKFTEKELEDALVEGGPGFRNFCKDMGHCPEGYILKRRDKNGNFEPKNCFWGPKRRKL